MEFELSCKGLGKIADPDCYRGDFKGLQIDHLSILK